MPIELVATAKILGLNVSSDLKWNSHIDSIIKKAQKHLHSFDCFLSCRFGFFLSFIFFLTNHNFTVVYSCIVCRLFASFAFLYRLAY